MTVQLNVDEPELHSGSATGGTHDSNTQCRAHTKQLDFDAILWNYINP